MNMIKATRCLLWPILLLKRYVNYILLRRQTPRRRTLTHESSCTSANSPCFVVASYPLLGKYYKHEPFVSIYPMPIAMLNPVVRDLDSPDIYKLLHSFDLVLTLLAHPIVEVAISSWHLNPVAAKTAVLSLITIYVLPRRNKFLLCKMVYFHSNLKRKQFFWRTICITEYT